MKAKEIAHKNLGIKPENKIILSIDGGGMRGIYTLQLLKKLEVLAGAPCYEWCDMVAGTSTGAIISALILSKKTATEIEQLYTNLVSKVFTKRNLFSDRFLNPPKFDKVNYRKALKEIIGDTTLEQACKDVGMDCFFTSKDMTAGEETFFTCFKNKEGNYFGTYKEALLRAIMEVTMSAPTYFSPLERFIDGGTTTYNNPTLAAVMEALQYSGNGQYQSDKLTVFSFGTGASLNFINPEDTHNPKGLDVAFWLNYVMEETGKDASEMQIDLLRSNLVKGLDLRRYQISLDEEAIKKIPNKDISNIHNVTADWLHDLTHKEIGQIDMADVSKFPLMKIIGEAVSEFICPPSESQLPISERKGNWFQKDFIDPKTKRGTLVTAHGAIETIKANLSNKAWLDEQPTK
ncbi:patatin-like phospholipase family protein [Flavobacterium sp. SUN046]|uniref:patatin-like phospholipase family protein n=1 Tax=Flavobacterium sp. SUN046 TaxID=3002440 RepID=UPI002DBBD9F8|nr:patatin-like phospholipase family protein [Flavobacterium sp. SUN046]MEC4050221.1 patatin-like phospholipase family protein [Flavobacterium sp. SUN046]